MFILRSANFKGILFLLLILPFFEALGQAKKPGTFYLSWGYNREAYTKSTLHLSNHSTDNYDFTMVKATAHDKNNFEHIGALNELTIPQYNLHIGYLFNDKRNLGVELSWDHLKYVVTDNQLVHVKGNIRGRELDLDTLVDPDFVHIQHTNGNNYLMGNIVKKHSLYKGNHTELSIHNKLGAGVLYSFTISTVLGNYDPGHFKIQGYVLGANTGLRCDIFKYFFLETTGQLAFAHYLNTELGADHRGQLSHHFFSGALALQFGFNLPMETFKKK
ncbi:MAG: hypothetical protein SGJ00_07525 [bacterium]|nr:hypothetical protein [bacterium]